VNGGASVVRPVQAPPVLLHAAFGMLTRDTNNIVKRIIIIIIIKTANPVIAWA
jgi:hypothetical protein